VNGSNHIVLGLGEGLADGGLQAMWRSVRSSRNYLHSLGAACMPAPPPRASGSRDTGLALTLAAGIEVEVCR